MADTFSAMHAPSRHHHGPRDTSRGAGHRLHAVARRPDVCTGAVDDNGLQPALAIPGPFTADTMAVIE